MAVMSASSAVQLKDQGENVCDFVLKELPIKLMSVNTL